MEILLLGWSELFGLVGYDSESHKKSDCTFVKIYGLTYLGILFVQCVVSCSGKAAKMITYLSYSALQ